MIIKFNQLEHKAHVTVYETGVEQTNDSTQKTKGTNY